MNTFYYQDGQLFCGQVPVADIARQEGTPFYLYSHEALVRQFKSFDDAFAGFDHLICYSVKACSNLSVVSLFASLGGGSDVVSGGELFRALKAGVPADKIVFSGVGKTDNEINAALDAGILMFNVESSQELDCINELAGKKGVSAPVALRVNPDVDPLTHPYISTGLSANKFGIPIAEALSLFQRAANLPHITVIGVDCHIGSQLTQVSPFRAALERLKPLIDELRSLHIAIRYLDIGGGVGITYDAEEPPLPAEYAHAVMEVVEDLGCTLIMEPGRSLVGNAGILVSRVVYEKDGATKRFVIVDAGMNDLVRPSLYNAYQKILPVREFTGKDDDKKIIDVVGPICESGDFLAQERLMPPLKRGDLLAVMSEKIAANIGYSIINSPKILFTGKSISGSSATPQEKIDAFIDFAPVVVSLGMTKTGQIVKTTKGLKGYNQFVKKGTVFKGRVGKGWQKSVSRMFMMNRENQKGLEGLNKGTFTSGVISYYYKNKKRK